MSKPRSSKRKPAEPILLGAAMAARAHGDLAIEVLASIAADPDAPATARVAAASKLLERGYGRAVADAATGGEAEFSALSDAELCRLLDVNAGIVSG